MSPFYLSGILDTRMVKCHIQVFFSPERRCVDKIRRTKIYLFHAPARASLGEIPIFSAYLPEYGDAPSAIAQQDVRHLLAPVGRPDDVAMGHIQAIGEMFGGRTPWVRIATAQTRN